MVFYFKILYIFFKNNYKSKLIKILNVKRLIFHFIFVKCFKEIFETFHIHKVKD